MGIFCSCFKNEDGEEDDFEIEEAIRRQNVNCVFKNLGDFNPQPLHFNDLNNNFNITSSQQRMLMMLVDSQQPPLSPPKESSPLLSIPLRKPIKLTIRREFSSSVDSSEESLQDFDSNGNIYSKGPQPCSRSIKSKNSKKSITMYPPKYMSVVNNPPIKTITLLKVVKSKATSTSRNVQYESKKSQANLKDLKIKGNQSSGGRLRIFKDQTKQPGKQVKSMHFNQNYDDDYSDEETDSNSLIERYDDELNNNIKQKDVRGNKKSKKSLQSTFNVSSVNKKNSSIANIAIPLRFDPDDEDIMPPYSAYSVRKIKSSKSLNRMRKQQETCRRLAQPHIIGEGAKRIQRSRNRKIKKKLLEKIVSNSNLNIQSIRTNPVEELIQEKSVTFKDNVQVRLISPNIEMQSKSHQA